MFKLPKKIILLVLVWLLISGNIPSLEEYLDLAQQPDTSVSVNATELVKCKVKSVVDGDTISIVYNGKTTKVRLIGIDTPESVHADENKNTEFGAMASKYTKECLSGVKYIYLEFDEEMYDTYDRLLAYVYLDASPSDFTESLNYSLVREGYAVNKEYPPNVKYADLLAEAKEDAKNEKIGLWEISGLK